MTVRTSRGERDPSPEPGANPFNPFKRKKVPSKKSRRLRRRRKRSRDGGRADPGKDEKPRPPLKKRQRSPPKQEEEEEEEEETLTCRKGCGRVFSHPPARVAHEELSREAGFFESS